jgi:hypothetical protein
MMAKLERLIGEKPLNMRERTGLEHWSTEALLRFLMDAGELTPADFGKAG